MPMPSHKKLPKKLYSWWDDGGGSPFVNSAQEPDVNPEQEMMVGVYELVGFAKASNKTTVEKIADDKKHR